MSKCNRPKNMTVIVRVAGWLAPFWFPCSRNATIRPFCSGKGQNFCNTIALAPRPPLPPQLSPPTIWFLPFNIPIRVQQREGCVCQMRNYMQRGGGSGRVGERGGRLQKGGFPSVVRTPSVPHFQLPIFYLPEISVFSSFSFAFCVRKELRNFIIYYRSTLAISTHAHLSNN